MEILASPQNLKKHWVLWVFIVFKTISQANTYGTVCLGQASDLPCPSTRGEPCVFTGVFKDKICEPALNEEWGEPSISELIS